MERFRTLTCQCKHRRERIERVEDDAIDELRDRAREETMFKRVIAD
jgi:hypothetical protein